MILNRKKILSNQKIPDRCHEIIGISFGSSGLRRGLKISKLAKSLALWNELTFDFMKNHKKLINL
jgi:hypothetical protein